MSASPETVRPVGLAGLFGLLRRNADFRRLFVATVISFAGDWFAFVAVSGFVTEVTGRSGSAAWVYAANLLPTFLLSPIAGVVADRMDRKRLLVITDLLRVPLALGLCVALYLQSSVLAILFVGLLAALAAFFEPVSAAATPNVVDPDDLPVAQAGMSAVWGSMLFIGAALGGFVSALLGRQATLVINAVTFAVSAVLLLRIRRPLQQGFLAAGALWTHLHDVYRLARRQLVTLSLMTTKMGVGLANGIVGLLPAFALTRFGTGDEGIGVLLAARGLGSLFGSFLGQRMARGEGRRGFFLCGLGILLYGTAYLALPLAPSLGWAAACAALAHMGGGAQWSLSTFGLQVTTPDVLRGRVMTLDFGLATLAMGLSSLGAAAGAEWLGLERTAQSIALIAVVYGLGFLVWTRPLWRGPSDPFALSPRTPATPLDR